MNRSRLQSTLREMQQHLGDPRVLGAMAITGVLLGLAGPFGSFESIELLPRIAYWLAIVVGTYGAGYGLSSLADAAWGEGLPLWLRFLIMVVPAGIGATVIVTILNLIAFGTGRFTWQDVPLLVAQCFVVSLGVVALLLLTERRETPAHASGPAPILERVPLPQRGRLLALVVEDHYVDIITDRGKALVLMRLADAIRETTPIAGLQIHRSHWVARDAVARAHRVEGKIVLELSNGMRLPVSRGYASSVREAGLI